MIRAASILSLLLFSCAAGCSSAPTEEVDDTSDELSSKKTTSLAALADTSWVSTSTSADDGDVIALRLFADGSYVRLRCYQAGCAEAVPETDHFTAFTSKGKTYIEFWSFRRVLVTPPATKGAPPPKGVPPKGGGVAAPEWDDQPAVADTYEIKKSGATLKLRKTYTTSWTKLAAVTDDALCGDSGGTWTIPPPPPATPAKGAPPTTKGTQPASPPPAGATPAAPLAPPPYCACPTAGDGFVAPIGCMHLTVSTESACDDTNGSYTDDDATKIGTYCQCGIGRVMTETGCVDL